MFNLATLIDTELWQHAFVCLVYFSLNKKP